ncbi:MAG: hypothetical protein U9M92_01490 [Patescibacteria group bacterium]|nr:hypothetical protein [Patescibacteria group bacterium]
MDWLVAKKFIAQALAADSVQLLETIPGLGNEVSGIEKYLGPAFTVVLGLAAAIAVVQFAYGGLLHMMSELPSGKSNGTGKMKSAVWGLILLLAAWLILNEINPDLVKLSNIFGGSSS